MRIKFAVILALVLASCHPAKTTRTEEKPSDARPAVRYISTDRSYALLFTGDGFRAGDFTVFREGIGPVSPAKTLDNKNGMQCISVGPPGNMEEFALKRPIKAGDRYKCGGTSFTVERCLDGCETAIIDREVPLTGGRPGTIKSSMLVDRCLGVLAFNQIKTMADGIPLEAALLRDKVGILADNNHPDCADDVRL